MRFSQSNQLVILMVIFNIQDMRISILSSGKIYFLLKLRCFCGYCCRVVWVLEDFSALEELLIIDHLFIHCYVTWRFWNRFMRGNDGCMPTTVHLLLQEWNHLLHGKFQRKAIYRFMPVVYLNCLQQRCC